MAPVTPLTHDDRLWAGLSYAACFLFGVPALLIYFWKRDDSDFVRFNAVQACCFGIVWLLLFIPAVLFSRVVWLSFLCLVVPVLCWIYLMAAAFMGYTPRLPFLSETLAKRIP